MPEGSAYQRVIEALERAGQRVIPRGSDEAMACCPAHGDRSPSLHLTGIEGQVLVYCHAGCDAADVLGAVDLSLRDMFDDPQGATYRYDDGRTVRRSPDKRFSQVGNTRGRPQLYRLAQVREAVLAGTPVHLVEGEKDVHALERMGAVATTAPMGAGNFSKADVSPLKGARLVIIPDQDESGSKWLGLVLEAVADIAESLEVRKPRWGKDAADHLAAGHDLADFELDTEALRGDRTLRLCPASSIVPRVVRWAWDTAPEDAPLEASEGRIPIGSLVIAAGHAGIGKSQMACWMTACVTKGILPGCWWGRPRSVIYAASEDSWEMTIVPRLMAAGADLARVYRVEVVDSLDRQLRLVLPLDMDRLKVAIIEEDVAMVVMDPMLSLIDAEVDDYRAREVRTALEPLVELADRTGAVLLAIAHFTKASASDPLALISGSAAFGQLIRAALGFVHDEESQTFILSTIKNNLGRKTGLRSLEYRIDPAAVSTPEGTTWVSRVVFTGADAPRSVEEVLRARSQGSGGQTEAARAGEILAEYLTEHGGGAPAKAALDAVMAAGFTERTVQRAKKALGVTTEREGWGAPALWILPKVAHSRQSRHAQERGESGENEGNEASADYAPSSAERPEDDPWAAP